MAGQDSIVRFRDTDQAQAALVVAARNRGETVSELIRRAIRKEVPGLAALELPTYSGDPAELLARILSGEDGASAELLTLAANGSEEDRADLLNLLVAFVIFEVPAPSLSAADLRSLAGCTAERLVPIGPLEPAALS